MIKESGGTLIHSQERRLARWTEHFRDRFSWLTAAVDSSLMPASESIEVDIRPPSEMDVTREMGLLKRHKAAGPDGLSVPYSKDVAKC